MRCRSIRLLKNELHVMSDQSNSVAPILLDVSRLVWRTWIGKLPTGIDRTCLAYVAHFRDRARAVVQRGGVTRVLKPKLSRALFEVLLTSSVDSTQARLRSIAVRSVGEILHGTSTGEFAGHLYLNVGHTGLDRVGHGRWVVRSGVRSIYFVHDLIPLTHPEYCRPDEPQKHLRRITAMLGNATGIIGNSRDTLNELTAFAGLQDVLHTPPTLVAPLGVEIGWMPPSEALPLPLPGHPYFVMLGTIEGRKNHLLILTIWADLVRRLGASAPQLIIIGKRGWESEQTVDMLERSQAIRMHVIELSHCDDAMLQAYLRNARALLFPSFAEGYGLPLVEALACGTPVIASDLQVFRELAGNIPDYIYPIDGLGWMKAIEDYAPAGSIRRSNQLDRLDGWAPPTWSDHFEKVDRWLEQLVAIPPQGVSSAPSD
jgi:glycosyltransferase involved in cell wall biosynthesis